MKRMLAFVFMSTCLASCALAGDADTDEQAVALPPQFLLVMTRTDATPTITAYDLEGKRLRSFRNYEMTSIGDVLQRGGGGRYRLTRAGLVPTSANPERATDTCSPSSTARTRVCAGDPTSADEPTIILTRDGATRRVTGAPFPGDPTGRFAGHWARAALSPDGRTVLATWSGECESPAAFLVDVESGRAFSPMSGGDHPREAHGLGWTAAGDAVISFTTGVCGSAVDVPGVYLIRADGSLARRVLRLDDEATETNLITL